MADHLTRLLGHQRNGKGVSITQSVNNELLGVTAAWVRQERQACDFTNNHFVGWTFWADSDCHWFKRANNQNKLP